MPLPRVSFTVTRLTRAGIMGQTTSFAHSDSSSVPCTTCPIQAGQLLTPYNGAPASNIYGVLTDFANFTPGCALATSGSTFTRVTNRWINAGCEAPYPAV